MSTNDPRPPDPNEPHVPGGATPHPPETPRTNPPYPGAQPGDPASSPAQPGPAYPPASGAAYPGAPQAAGYAGPPPKNNLGVWSLVLGIVSWLICPIIASIGAIITGHMSRRAVREGQADNGSMGLAGLILGWASLILSIAAIVIVVVAINTAVNDPGVQDILNDPSMFGTFPDGS